LLLKLCIIPHFFYPFLLFCAFQATAGSAESVKDDLNGLDKAVSAVLGERTIERNLLLVKVAKSKLAKRNDDKNEKVTKPEELVRLYDLLLQVGICVLFVNWH
jgi:hypothetical protein